MPSDSPNTPTRWRPRFSVRTLVVIVTMVCCYFGLWEATKARGIGDVCTFLGAGEALDERTLEFWYGGFDAPMPLVVATDTKARWGRRRYYFWFFGYVAKLPYERELERPPPYTLGDVRPPPTPSRDSPSSATLCTQSGALRSQV